MPEKLDQHILKNGMVILGEPMDGVESVAFSFMIPAGAARLPEGCCGAATVITDWIFRGAGNKNSRELCDCLDGLGLHRGTSVSSSHITLGAVLEAGNLSPSIKLYGEIISDPALKDDQFELSRQLAIQELLSLDDEPQQKVMLELREQFYPPPLGRNPIGKDDDLKALTPRKTAELVKQNFNLSQTIFSVAGKYDFDALCKQLQDLFETDQQRNDSKIKIGEKGGNYIHKYHDGAQVHIGVMTKTVTINSLDYYNAMAAAAVLSGGMSSRLFTEVREKRGLCYAIGAQYHCLKDLAGIMCYAGTTPEKAQETLDVVIAEFGRLADGISQEEIDRAKIGLKSTLILQSESSRHRANGIASDFYLLGRVRTLEEIKNKIEQISPDSVLTFLRSNKFEDFTIVTIGPKNVDYPN